MRVAVGERVQIRVFDHDRHVDLRLGGIGDTAHEVARRQQAAVGIGARARESEILERNAVTLQEQRSVERTSHARSPFDNEFRRPLAPQ